MDEETFTYNGYRQSRSKANRLRKLAAAHGGRAEELIEARRRAVRALAEQLRADEQYEDDLAVVRNAAARRASGRTEQ